MPECLWYDRFTILHAEKLIRVRTVNSVDDFCIFAPPEPGADSVIGNTERIEVAWCIKPGYGTRLIPDGTITGAHFVQTPDYVQVTGVGNLTMVNIPQGDAGGELDPHGADGNGVYLMRSQGVSNLILTRHSACRQPHRRIGVLERVRIACADS